MWLPGVLPRSSFVIANDILSSFLDGLCLSLVRMYYIMLSRPVSVTLLVASMFCLLKLVLP